MVGRLNGRTAVITGGASGIGRAAAELFTQEGARVLAVDLPGSDLGFESDAILPFEADVAADEAPAGIVGAARGQLGGLDILFNNAGISDRGGLTEIDDAFFDRMLDINLRAGFRLIREAVPLLKASKFPRIISTASVAALRSGPGLGAYSASKAGLVGLTRSFAYELGEFGVTANCILPGATLTQMTQRTLGVAAYAEEQASRTALRRIGAPIDIARVALFLASDDSGYVTGQSIAVDGGMTIRA